MNNNPYKLIVFDWEGTLSDTLGSILHTVSSEAERLGFGPLDFDLARKYIELGLIQAVRKVFSNLSMTDQEELLQSTHHALVTKPTELYLIPGAREFIQELYDLGVTLAIATNKGQHSLKRALQTTQLEDFFKITRSAGQTPAKPCPQMLEEIMEACGMKAEETLMIGDSAADMEMAQSIHVAAIGVDFYHQQENILKSAGALMVVDNYSLLAKFLGLPKL